MSYQWLYKESIETGIMVPVEDVPKYIKQGYVDTPDKYNKKEVVEEEDSLESMSKADLESYAKAQFNVDIDRRKSHKNLVKEIEALEAN